MNSGTACSLTCPGDGFSDSGISAKIAKMRHPGAGIDRGSISPIRYGSRHHARGGLKVKRFSCSATMVFVLIILAVMAGAAGAEEPSIGKLPPGWAEREPIDASIDRYFVYEMNGIVRIELSMLEEELPEPYRPGDYMKEMKKHLAPGFKDYVPLDDEATKIRGLDAAVHRFTFTGPQETIKAEVYAFVIDETAYILLFDSSETWFKKMQPKFRQFIDEAVKIPGAPAPEPEEEITEDDDDEIVMPEFDEEDIDAEAAFFGSARENFYITLPEGWKKGQVLNDYNWVEALGPKNFEMIVSMQDSKEQTETMFGKYTGDLSRIGASTLRCGGGVIPVTLYSDSEDGVKLVVLTAVWEGTGAGILLQVPKKEYNAASGWIKEMLCSVRIEKK